jgi:ankyrin repeat protein
MNETRIRARILAAAATFLPAMPSTSAECTVLSASRAAHPTAHAPVSAAPYVIGAGKGVSRIEALRFDAPTGDKAMRVIRSPYYLSARNARVENPISSREMVLRISPRDLGKWQDPVPPDADDPQWRLRQAVIRNDIAAAVELLDSRQANANRGLRSDANYRVINDAAYLGRIEIVRALIRHGARTRPLSIGGESHLDAAGEALLGLSMMSTRLQPGGFYTPGSEDFDPTSDGIPEAAPHAATVRLLMAMDLFEARHGALQDIAGMGPFAAQQELALELIRRGHSDMPGTSALELAARRGNEPMVRLLMEHRTFSPEVVARAMYALAQLGRARVAGELVARGADGSGLAQARGLDVFRALGTAKDPSILQLMLDQGLDPTTTFEGRTLLMAAIPDAALMTRLIKLGLDVNARAGRDGRTALHVAVEPPRGGLDPWAGLNATADPAKRREAVRILLAHGANPNLMAGKQTALMRSVQDEAMIDALIAAGGMVVGGDETSTRYGEGSLGPVAWAIVSDKEILALRLLSGGVGLAPADCGAVHYAASMGMARVLAALLDMGAATDRLDQWDDTPLRAAARVGQVDTMRVLMVKGRVAVDEPSPTRVHSGLVVGHGVAVRLPGLVGGATALHRAAQGGHAEAVKLLLDHGADAGARTSEGKAPIDLASSTAVRKLLEAGRR